MKRKRTRCPICRRPTTLDDLHFPFCSQRCRLIDLGRWAGEDYRVPEKADETGEPGKKESEE